MKNLILAFTVFTFGANMAMGDLGKAGEEGNSASSPTGGSSSSPFAGVPNLCQAKVEETKRTFKSMFGLELNVNVRTGSIQRVSPRPSRDVIIQALYRIVGVPAEGAALGELNALYDWFAQLPADLSTDQGRDAFIRAAGAYAIGYLNETADSVWDVVSGVLYMPLGRDAVRGPASDLVHLAQKVKIAREGLSLCLPPADAAVVAAFAALVASPAAGLMVKNATKGKRPFNGVSNAAAVATALGLLLFAASLED